MIFSDIFGRRIHIGDIVSVNASWIDSSGHSNRVAKVTNITNYSVVMRLYRTVQHKFNPATSNYVYHLLPITMQRLKEEIPDGHMRYTTTPERRIIILKKNPHVNKR